MQMKQTVLRRAKQIYALLKDLGEDWAVEQASILAELYT